MIVQDLAQIPLMGAVARLGLAAKRRDLEAISALCKQIEELTKGFGPADRDAAKIASAAVTDALALIGAAREEVGAPTRRTAKGRETYLKQGTGRE